ncbi:MAG: hypothetical protein QOD71_796 [Thermoleophilaceae bacterium]|jgi:hypothetical protein|nr:hypothetical protein [Thermoleophilaceae bacterium]
MAPTADSSQTPEAARKQRLRWGALPRPAAEATLSWGKQREELQGLTAADVVRLILQAPEFEAVLGPTLDAIDERNAGQKARPVRWKARQLESLLIYRRVSGLGTIKRTRERLTFDRAGRMLLGFGDELPSQATISRYLRQHFDDAERAELMKELERRLRLRVTELPGFEDDAAILGMDGSKIEIHHTPPIRALAKPDEPPGPNNPRTGPILNPDKVTAPEAGYVGGDSPKSGRGFQMVAIWTEHGTPLAWDISHLNENEKTAAGRAMQDYAKNVLPRRDPARLAVLSADGGFDSNNIRRQLQELRIVPNVHRASHGRKESSINNVAKLDEQRFPLHDPLKPAYANWFANGHGELSCRCGDGHVERQIGVTNGRLSIASVGRCSNCGSVRINAGKWKRAQNATRAQINRFVRVLPGDEGDRYFGNPLTFNDPLASKYGRDRFSWGESFHSTLSSRFGLLRDRCWMRGKAQAETEFAIAFAAIHSLTLERARKQALEPPGEAVAA